MCLDVGVGGCLSAWHRIRASIQSVSDPRLPPTYPPVLIGFAAWHFHLKSRCLLLVLSPPPRPHPFDARSARAPRPAAGRSLVGPDWINIICSPPIFSSALVSISHRASFAYPLHAIFESVHSRSLHSRAVAAWVAAWPLLAGSNTSANCQHSSPLPASSIVYAV